MERKRSRHLSVARDILALRIDAIHRLGEEGAMPRRLDDNEYDIAQNGYGGEEAGLERIFGRVGDRLGIVRDDETEHGKRGDDHEEGARAFEIIFLLPIA